MLKLGALISTAIDEDTGIATLTFNESMPPDEPNPVMWFPKRTYTVIVQAELVPDTPEPLPTQ